MILARNAVVGNAPQAGEAPSRPAALGVGMVAPVTGDDVLVAAELVERTLEAHLRTDWSAPVPGLDFTVASVVAHAAGAMLWYAVDLWSGRDDAAFEITLHTDAPNDRLLTSLTAAARALAAGIDSAPADTRWLPPLRLAGSRRVRRHGVRRAAGSR